MKGERLRRFFETAGGIRIDEGLASASASTSASSSATPSPTSPCTPTSSDTTSSTASTSPTSPSAGPHIRFLTTGLSASEVKRKAKGVEWKEGGGRERRVRRAVRVVGEGGCGCGKKRGGGEGVRGRNREGEGEGGKGGR